MHKHDVDRIVRKALLAAGFEGVVSQRTRSTGNIKLHEIYFEFHASNTFQKRWDGASLL